MNFPGNDKERAPIFESDAETLSDSQDSPESGEVKEKSSEVGEGVGGVVESVEGAESVEVAGENISEKVSEGKKRAPSGGIKSGGTAGSQAISDYDFAIPKVEIMRIQVATKVNKEIVELEREARKLIKSSVKFTPYKLNIVIKRIRALREILAELATATTETLKGWWLQFIKGISS